MAEVKTFECIIEFEPYALQNKNEICFQSKRVQELIRCKDCKHTLTDGDALYCKKLDWWELNPNGFCHLAEKK